MLSIAAVTSMSGIMNFPLLLHCHKSELPPAENLKKIANAPKSTIAKMIPKNFLFTLIKIILGSRIKENPAPRLIPAFAKMGIV